ncbi:MAG: hypothetical protein IPK42_05040 [Betaproteobacteria bacterium]|nr:hypothetical protein [Betaproteobacteria bacterium]
MVALDTPAVLRVLEAEPEKGKGTLWATRTETASRLRGRIEVILDYATTKGLREGPNPARWKGHLALTLPAKRKVAPVEHHAALPVAEMPRFMRSLRAVEGMSARALFHSPPRAVAKCGAQWTEVDLTAKVWTVPASRMKAGREHRVPLSDAAIAVLKG